MLDNLPAAPASATEVVERILRSAAEDDFATAGAAAEQLFELRGKLPSFARLRDIARGSVPIQWTGRYACTVDAELSVAVRSLIDEAIDQCAAFLEQDPPVLLMDVAPVVAGVHLTVENFPGFAVVQLHTNTAPTALRAAVFHEIAHAFLTCGVRFLDEGFAELFTTQFVPMDLARIDSLSFSLPTLLSQAANEGLFFEGVGADVSQARQLRGAGARLLATIRERGGAAGLKVMFAAVRRAGDDREVEQIVAGAYGAPLSQFLPVHQPMPETASTQSFLDAMFEAYRRREPGCMDASLASLERAGVVHDPVMLDMLIRLRIARAVLQLNLGATVSSADLSRTDLYIYEASTISEARLWALRGHRAVLGLKRERANFAKAVFFSRRAANAYARACQLDQSDPDLMIGLGLYLVNSPAKFGGDRERGIGMISECLSHRVYGAHALDVLRELGEAPPPEPRVPDELAPGCGALQKTVPIVDATDLIVRVSPEFRLTIPKLSVSAGSKTVLIGPNGSGKTMLLETITGLRAVQSGHLQWFGSATQLDKSHRRRMGALLSNAPLQGAMFVHEVVGFHEMVYGKKSAVCLERLGVADLLELKIRALSRGQLQRVKLYLALAHEPELVLLDEPTLGLDEKHARQLRDLLASISGTLVLISHDPEDVALGDTIVCIRAGTMFDTGSLDSLLHQHVGWVRVEIEHANRAVHESARQLPGVLRHRVDAKGSLGLYGTPELRTEFLAFASREQIQAFSVHNTQTEDLLALLANDND
jgi:ABC-type multidrug transport system ATPase subunit